MQESADFEPSAPAQPASDRWEGEDEDDDVKDNWEDEDEEEKKSENEGKSTGTAYQRPKKKPLAERIAEKNRAKQAEEEKKEEKPKELTPEEKLAERIRLQKIQEEADLKLAKGLFGVRDGQGIDGMYPENEEQFEQFGEALKSKITFFEGSKLYPAFAAKLIHDVSLTLPADDIKKIGIALNSLYHEKERQRKEQAKNQKKKKAGKVNIKMGKADDLGLADEAGAYYDDDDDDFL
ncbi:eukaryotic translation initiation factor 3 subunit j [Plakobranchus ocellatus]|uniref:Eukaryotic translation initiation factor 3 subunit J n=1 Tax=Plakobranchus ocellatus TaxID=259542 RepID=A0AAV4CQR0_9GAST|nr:eukaryotic translation initiation factor 3 subunit j [Plakobranchus ocellatus]